MLEEKKDDLITASQPLAIYKNNKSFQEIVKRKYNITQSSLLYDDGLLLLIYTYEWFNIPKCNVYDLVGYNPLITRKHFDKLTKKYEHQKNIYLLTILPFFAIMYYLKIRYVKGSNFRKNFTPMMALGFMSIFYPFALWNYFFVPRMNYEIKSDEDLKSYLNLNVDKDKIQRDLLNFNIVL